MPLLRPEARFDQRRGTPTALSRRSLLIFVFALAAIGAVVSRAADNEYSEPSHLAAKSLLLDIAAVGTKLVAVGDRGHVLVSLDNGNTWTQRITPTRTMLTGVSFSDADHGWAVGHDGVILVTRDGGKTWKRQDQGKDLDNVFLDVLFVTADRGFIIGAYGKFFETQDGGETWRERKIYNEDLHFNRITRDRDQLFIVGEAGLLLRSKDLGKTWERSSVPYEGSLYGVLALSGGVHVSYGLRGHIFVSTDDGATWTERLNDVKVLIMSGARLRDGVIVLAGHGGNFFISRDAGRSFHHWKPEHFSTSVADLAVAADGALVTVGEAGAVKLNIP